MMKQALFCNCKKTFLHMAIKHGLLNKVERLLKKGSSLSVKDTFGKVPLQYVCKLGSYDFRRILDVVWLRITKHPKDFTALRAATGLLPIHLACLRDDYWTVKLLLKENRPHIKKKTFANCSRWPNYTPLHFAVIYGSHELLHLLLLERADSNDRNKYGETPLHLAIAKGKVDIFHNLISFGADPYCKTYRALTCLRLALISKDQEGIDAVLHYTLDNPVDNKGMTPLHYCCDKGLRDKVLSFLENGTDVDFKVHTFASRLAGFTPLHIAVVRKDLELIRLLMDNGANADMLNSDLLTAVELVYCTVKDVKLQREMLDILKENGYVKIENLKIDNDKLDCIIDNAYDNMDEPVVIEIDPAFNKEIKDIEERIQDKLAFKKCLPLTRQEMTTLFFRYGECNCIVKISLKKNGDLVPSFVYGSFNGLGRKKKNVPQVYDYYVVNDLALQSVISFGLDLGNDIDEIQLGNEKHIPKNIVYIYLRHMEIRRLLGVGGKNEMFWKNKIIEEIPEPSDWYTEDLDKLPKVVNEEMEAMKKLKLGTSGTLLDLIKDQHKLSKFLYRNPFFVQMFHAHEFSEKLPNCIGVLKLQCSKAVERWTLIEPATVKLSKIIKESSGLRWVDDCSEMILPYLDVEDLKSLIMV